MCTQIRRRGGREDREQGGRKGRREGRVLLVGFKTLYVGEGL